MKNNGIEYNNLVKECFDVIIQNDTSLRESIEYICHGTKCKIENRQFDVLYKVTNSIFSHYIAIEAKDETSKINVGVVDGFVTKCDDKNIAFRYIVSRHSFQKGCEEIAKKHNIKLIELDKLNSKHLELFDKDDIDKKTTEIFNTIKVLSKINIVQPDEREIDGNKMSIYPIFHDKAEDKKFTECMKNCNLNNLCIRQKDEAIARKINIFFQHLSTCDIIKEDVIKTEIVDGNEIITKKSSNYIQIYIKFITCYNFSCEKLCGRRL